LIKTLAQKVEKGAGERGGTYEAHSIWWMNSCYKLDVKRKEANDLGLVKA